MAIVDGGDYDEALVILNIPLNDEPGIILLDGIHDFQLNFFAINNDGTSIVISDHWSIIIINLSEMNLSTIEIFRVS